VSSGGLKKVRALVWSNGPAIDEHFKQRVKKFNDSHQGQIEVDMQFLPYDQYWQKIDLAYSSNQPYDIYYWDVQAYAHYKKGLLLNLSPLLRSNPEIMDESKYPVKLYDPWKFDGANLYGMPENIQTMVLFYNKDIFDKAGMKYPDANWTWQDTLTAARKLTLRQGDKTTQWGMDLAALGIWWGSQTLSWAQGTDYFDKVLEPTKFQMENPANINTIRFIQDLIWKEKVMPNAAQRQAAGQDVGVFQSGKAAMIADGGWNIASFASLPFKWDIAPLPKWNDKRVVPYWLGGWNIPKASKVTDAAFEFARWSATEYQTQMAKDHDWIPILNSARTGSDMLAGMPSGFKASIDALSSAKIGDLYHSKSQQILNEVLGPIFDQVYQNKIKPEDAAKQIDQKADALLKQG
jgi:multiple sugar transport system substrate-binding protein